MKISDLGQNKRNPRRITATKKEALKSAMEEFGDLGPIIFNVRTKQLVGGNQRSKILPPDAEVVIESKFTPATRTGTVAEGFVLYQGEKFRYRQVDWDSDREMAALLAANSHGGEWDTDLLKFEVKKLAETGYKMELTGVDTRIIDEMKAKISASAAKIPELQKPVMPQTPQVPQTQAQPEAPKADPFSGVGQKQEITKKRFVIILDCPNEETKEALKSELRKDLLKKFNATIF